MSRTTQRLRRAANPRSVKTDSYVPRWLPIDSPIGRLIGFIRKRMANR
jgi:hypothetical protein